MTLNVRLLVIETMVQNCFFEEKTVKWLKKSENGPEIFTKRIMLYIVNRKGVPEEIKNEIRSEYFLRLLSIFAFISKEINLKRMIFGDHTFNTQN